MTKYELKKVFARTSAKIALLLLAALVVIVCYFSCGVSYVNELGETKTGFSAAAALRMEQKKWTGLLDEDKIRQVIAENKKIVSSPEYLSEDITAKEIAYSRGQGISEIRNLLNSSYAVKFREYDYYRADHLTEADAPQFYSNRIALLKQWLEKEAEDQFSEAEKAYLVKQYERLRTPFYYDYTKGWSQLFEFAPTIVMITMLILGYLVSGIFSGEFSWKSDAIFFSSAYGRNKGTAAKIKAGFWMVTVIYFAVMLAYTTVTLLYLGADGWACPIQLFQWKSFYNISIWQEYLLILVGGYIGCLFISFLSMLVSAKTRSAVTAVTVSFLLIFIPSFIANINSPIINKIIGLLPDQLLQTGTALNFFNLYSIGQSVVGAVPILLTVYSMLTLTLVPVMYGVYRHRQVS